MHYLPQWILNDPTPVSWFELPTRALDYNALAIVPRRCCLNLRFLTYPQDSAVFEQPHWHWVCSSIFTTAQSGLTADEIDEAGYSHTAKLFSSMPPGLGTQLLCLKKCDTVVKFQNKKVKFYPWVTQLSKRVNKCSFSPIFKKNVTGIFYHASSQIVTY